MISVCGIEQETEPEPGSSRVVWDRAFGFPGLFLTASQLQRAEVRVEIRHARLLGRHESIGAYSFPLIQLVRRQPREDDADLESGSGGSAHAGPVALESGSGIGDVAELLGASVADAWVPLTSSGASRRISGLLRVSVEVTGPAGAVPSIRQYPPGSNGGGLPGQYQPAVDGQGLLPMADPAAALRMALSADASAADGSILDAMQTPSYQLAV